MLPDFTELLEPPQLFGFLQCKFDSPENIGFFQRNLFTGNILNHIFHSDMVG